MSDARGTGPDLVSDQRLALTSYLESLLREVPEWTPEPPGQVPAVTPHPAPGTGSASAPAATTAPARAPARERAGMPAPEGLQDVPEWGREPFECLLFQVAGLSLAAPLIRLNGVIPWQEVTPMPDHSSTFLGLLQHQGRQIKVVDLAQIVFPEGRAVPPAQERVEHIVLVHQGRWGLACDAIGDVLSLQPGDVRWRSAQGKRPWLAGTARQHLCALLHTDALVQLLAAEDSGTEYA